MPEARPLVLYTDSGRIEGMRQSDWLPSQIPYPKRTGTPKIVGDVAGSSLTTLTLIASQIYFIPLVVPRDVQLTGLRLSVTTSAAGTASIGIYDNAVVGGNDSPGSLLASVTNLNTGTTGDKTGALSYKLKQGKLYWAAMIASAAAKVRAVSLASCQVSLGRLANDPRAAICLYATGTGSTLPETAPTAYDLISDLINGLPAIYLLE